MISTRISNQIFLEITYPKKKNKIKAFILIKKLDNPVPKAIYITAQIDKKGQLKFKCEKNNAGSLGFRPR